MEETGGEGGRGKRNHPTFLKAPNTSTMLGMGEGGKGSCKVPENEGRGRAGGNTLPFLKATDTTSIRGGGGFKWKNLGRVCHEELYFGNLLQ